MSKFSRIWLEVDTSASASNFRNMRRLVKPAKVLAVLKADGYGLGADRLARTVVEAGAARIGVATAEEARKIPALGVPVQIMSSVFPEELPWLLRHDIELPLADLSMAPVIDKAAGRLGRKARVHVKLDTGMGRLGILPAETALLPETLRGLANIDCVGVFTHFPLSTEHDPDFCRAQIELVRKTLAILKSGGIVPRWRHVANSDAICHLPEAAQAPFNLVRAGITMHGLTDMGESRPDWLKTVATLRSCLVSVRKLPAGGSIGYGATFKLKHPMLIGTIAAGYADGLPLALSNSCDVIVGGRRCPIVGRISMDYTTIDLTAAPEAKPGDIVTLFGRDGDCEISPNDWALLKRTHPYDIICSVSPRVPRVYS